MDVSLSQFLLTSDIPVDLSSCDLEPIHIPSLIQPHGMMLAARVADLRLVYTSQNAPLFLGVTSNFILGKTLIEILGPEAIASIEEALGPLQYVSRSVRALSFPLCPGKRFQVTAHRSGGLLCVELEVASAESRWDLLAARLKEATRALSVPTTLRDLLSTIPTVVRQLTGYDRIMVYQFHPDGHGEVVGEDKHPEIEPFLGLHYPDTDIPRQARKLYLKQRFRMIVDVDAVAVSLLGNRELIHDKPLDMTYCSLRSTSPMHLEYMRIMGVGASLGVSLVSSSGKLWGLIVGHHRTSKDLSPESRSLCDLLGQLVSLLIDSAEQADAAADYREKKSMLDLFSASLEKNLLVDDGFIENAQRLLSLVGADGAVFRLGGRLTLLGNTPSVEESMALLDAFQEHLHEETLSTDAVGTLLPAFTYLTPKASGALFVPFQEPFDGVLWLRAEVVHTMRWAGPPDASKQNSDSSARISPRRSFAVWEQTQHGRSLPWLPPETEAALGVQRIADRVSRLRKHADFVHLHTDQVTRLGNRLELLRRKEKWRAQHPQPPAALIFLDLDSFRLINDRYGHRVGDEFLRMVGARLGLLTDGNHFVARLGGDEFAIFCEDTSMYQAEQLSSIILKGLAEPFELMGMTLTTTASLGIAPIEWIEDTRFSDPLRVADSAMYVAKHKGGNQFSVVESREQAEILRAAIAEEDNARELFAHELATSYARLDAVLESTSDNVVTVRHDWTMLYANNRAASTISDFKIGADYWTCFPSVIGSSAERAVRIAMSERTEQIYEIFFESSRCWFRGKAFPVTEGISVFFSDITELKNNEEQLAVEQLLREKRIEALTHMAAGLAHEISNPLAIIHGLASDLILPVTAEMQVAPREVRVACEGIIKTVNRASNILRGLRGFAREAAQDPMELASIYEIVEQCLELQQDRLQRHQLELTLSMDPGIPNFFCREVQIGQIITNLVNNAFDAITQADAIQRWIAVSVTSAKNQTIIDVTDSGPGVQDQFRDHLMEAFFTTKERGLGMGIGLSLSRAIAQDHGGNLTLLEDAEHTTFRLLLPILIETASLPPLLLLAGVPK